MRNAYRSKTLDRLEPEPRESAIWRNLVTRFVSRGRSIADAFALADMVLCARAMRVAEGRIVPHLGTPSWGPNAPTPNAPKSWRAARVAQEQEQEDPGVLLTADE